MVLFTLLKNLIKIIFKEINIFTNIFKYIINIDIISIFKV